MPEKSNESYFSSHPISVIAHKLRTPLTVMMSTVGNLIDGAYGKLNGEQVKWLKKLVTHTQQLEKFLDEILEIVKAQASNVQEIKSELDKQPASATELHVVPSEGVKKSKPKQVKGDVPKILIVDDEPDILDTIEEGLKMKGFQTLATSKGEEAKKIAMEEKPDLILMDVLLEGLNGMDVCRQIKSQSEEFVPVILVTGQNDLRDKIAGNKNDADDLLTKPFQMEELFSRVNSMLRMKKLYDELRENNLDIGWRVNNYGNL